MQRLDASPFLGAGATNPSWRVLDTAGTAGSPRCFWREFHTPTLVPLRAPGAPGSHREVGSPFLAGALKCHYRGHNSTLGKAVICFLPEKARAGEGECERAGEES